MSNSRWITDIDEWQAKLDAIGGYDFYNLPDFIFQEAALLGGRPVAFHFELSAEKGPDERGASEKVAIEKGPDERVASEKGASKTGLIEEGIIPLILRDIPGQEGKWLDALSPYGYPGVLTTNEKYLDKVLTAFYEFAKQERIVSTFLRLHPIHNQILIPERTGLRQSLRGKTYSVYLPEGIEAIRANYSSNHRRNLKKLRKQGYTAVFDAWEHLPAWQQIYVQTMDRLGATDYYKFDLAYFEHLRTQLNCRLLTVHRPDGEVACGGLFTYYADVIQYHLGGTAESELNAAPSKLMFDTVIEDAATATAATSAASPTAANGTSSTITNSNYQWLHLGGGVGAKDDNLARFKKGFSNREHWFRTIEMVHHRDVYESLSQGKEDTGFFPLYRKG